MQIADSIDIAIAILNMFQLKRKMSIRKVVHYNTNCVKFHVVFRSIELLNNSYFVLRES